MLILDADERVTPELLAAMRALEPPREAAAYKFAWRNYLGKKWLAHGGLYAQLYAEQFGGGAVEARCADGVRFTDGKVLAARTADHGGD